VNIEIYTLSEKEEAVIQAAIDYIDHRENGLFRDVPVYRTRLRVAVHTLRFEHEGRWEPTQIENSAEWLSLREKLCR